MTTSRSDPVIELLARQEAQTLIAMIALQGQMYKVGDGICVLGLAASGLGQILIDFAIQLCARILP